MCDRDIVLLIDGSSSIGKSDFESAKKLSIEVLRQFKGEIDQGRAYVGVLQYGGEITFMCATGDLEPKYRVSTRNPDVGYILFLLFVI